jgi:hypothetical protein
VEAGAEAHHASVRAAYMRIAGYGSIQPWEELPESSREGDREHFREALAAYESALAEQRRGERDLGPCARKWVGETFTIACCPEHGFHGARDDCFECGSPVEQVPVRVVAEPTT